jgi:dipeptidyl-peptidase 4
MRALFRFLASASVAALLGSIANGQAPAASDQFTYFKNLAETRNYTLGLPVSPQLTPDGAYVIFLRASARDPVQRLFELNVQTGQERELLTPAQLLGSSEELLSPEEKARRERARISARGFTHFQLSKDGSLLLVTLSGQLHVVERSTLKVTPLPGANWIDPRFSPDGKFVAACAKGELHVIEIATREARQLTRGATDTISHGTAEFIAQEEMDRREGYWWSPDSTKIAFQKTDESSVEIRYIADPLHPESAPAKFFYPRAGSENARVTLGVINRDGGEPVWINWNATRYPYLARVHWARDGAPLTILLQNRAQQEQVLLEVDPATGNTRKLLQENDSAWLELDSSNKLPHWLPGAQEFLWTTERGGSWQVELRKRDGSFVRAVTPKDFSYRSFVGFSPLDAAVYVRGGYDPREVHLWRFSLGEAPAKQMTDEKGQHDAVFSKDFRRHVLVYELADGRSGARVRESDGRTVAELKSEAEQPRDWPKVEFAKTKTVPVFDAAIIRPKNFVAGRKYPVILNVYAGPSVKRVIAVSRGYFPDQWMADQGYIVVRIDNRGTPWMGREWSRAVRGNLIDVAMEDQISGLKALAEAYPEMDLSRVGVTGWSFGGYFAAMATIRRPDVFRAGVAGAPVITWENYDTHYTERYLGLPQENPNAYKVSSVLTYAEQLQRPLLLIHGMTDDNVYFQHTLQLADALFRAGKHYELLPLLGTHMVTEPNIRLQQQRRIMNFFAQHLGSE